MKYGQLIECNMRYHFFDTQNLVKKPVPDCFLTHQDWAYLWINSLNFIQFVFIVSARQGLAKRMKTNVLTTFFYFI